MPVIIMSNVHLHPSPYLTNIQFSSCPLCQWWVNWHTFLTTVLTAAFKTALQSTESVWCQGVHFDKVQTTSRQSHTYSLMLHRYISQVLSYCIKLSVTLISLSAWLGLDLTNIMLTDKLYLLTNFSNELRPVQMSISVEAFVCILAFHEKKSDFHLWTHADCVHSIESIQ